MGADKFFSDEELGLCTQNCLMTFSSGNHVVITDSLILRVIPKSTAKTNANELRRNTAEERNNQEAGTLPGKTKISNLGNQMIPF